MRGSMASVSSLALGSRGGGSCLQDCERIAEPIGESRIDVSDFSAQELYGGGEGGRESCHSRLDRQGRGQIGED